MAGFVPYTAQEIDDALTAAIAFAGNVSAAVKYLQEQGKRAPDRATLGEWMRVKHWERYEELREKLAAGREDQLANDFLDASVAAREVAMLAIERERARLETGKEDDPARAAANLAKVSQVMLDKRLGLQGRPATITETRDVNTSLRALVAMGVLKLPDEVAQIEAKVADG